MKKNEIKVGNNWTNKRKYIYGLSAIWKQTNLGYLRVDRLGCRLRRLPSEGEPSLLDSVLDSTPREKTSVNEDYLNFLSINFDYRRQ